MSDIKFFKCPYCPKVYDDISNLHKHFSANEKCQTKSSPPWRCNICRENFKNGSRYYKHLEGLTHRRCVYVVHTCMAIDLFTKEDSFIMNMAKENQIYKKICNKLIQNNATEIEFEK
jgi:hypothetical protein